MRIMDIGEKNLIKSIIRPMFEKTNIEVNVGDDAAVININSSQSLVLTTDKISEVLAAQSIGVMEYYDVGRYLIIANLSDIAAMGGQAIALLITLSLPKHFELTDLKKLITGIKDAAAEYNVPVVGGDTKNGSVMSLAATAIGIIEPGKALKRSGAKPEDIIFATGSPGAFATALAYLLVAKPSGMKLSSYDEKILLEKLVKPRASLDEGQELIKLGLINACQDISDGVGQTIYEIASMSGVGFEINSTLAEKAGLKPLNEIALFCNVKPVSILLGPGADFDLIFSVSPNNCANVEQLFQEKAWKLNRLGKFTENGYNLKNNDGTLKQIGPAGWHHFSPTSDIEALRSSFHNKNGT